MDIDDPDFWDKWAQKTNVDVNEIVDETNLIVYEPRQRRQGKYLVLSDYSI